MKKIKQINVSIFALALCLFLSISTAAQNSSFTYQGKLNDNGVPAGAAYDMRFRLFDAATAGVQIGATETKMNVPTVGGLFSVSLDFSSAAFDGAERWLEIAVSSAGQNNYVTLLPRQKIYSAPYAVQSLNAATAENSLRLGGIAANQYTLTDDARLSDARIPLPGSSNYVQNSQISQTGVNFSVGGTGSANVLNAAAQFNLGGSRILSNAGSGNLFAGIGAGSSNSGSFNAFFGSDAGRGNSSGTGNSFFGRLAGQSNTTGGNNTFLGFGAGSLNTTGAGNIFIGRNSGNANTGQITNSIVIGNDLTTPTSNAIVLGKIGQTVNVAGGAAEIFGTGLQNSFSGLLVTNLIFRNFGRDILPSPAQLCVRSVNAGTGIGWGLTQCSSALSSADNKIDIQPFAGGLAVINRLKPVTFKWKADGTEDIGLNAEDVAEIAPQLITRNESGKIEDVKKQSLNVLFINAFKEQQKQIEAQAVQIDQLKKMLCASNAQADVCREENEKGKNKK